MPPAKSAAVFVVLVKFAPIPTPRSPTDTGKPDFSSLPSRRPRQPFSVSDINHSPTTVEFLTSVSDIYPPEVVCSRYVSDIILIELLESCLRFYRAIYLRIAYAIGLIGFPQIIIDVIQLEENRIRANWRDLSTTNRCNKYMCLKNAETPISLHNHNFRYLRR